MPARHRRPENRIEFARTDGDLIERLRTSVWLAGKTYAVPVWLKTVAASDGDPSLIPSKRLDDLRDGNRFNPINTNERRYIRNKAVIKQIYADLRRQAPQYITEYSFEPTNSDSALNNKDDDDEVVVVSSRPVSRSRPPQTLPIPASTLGLPWSHSTLTPDEAAVVTSLPPNAPQYGTRKHGTATTTTQSEAENVSHVHPSRQRNLLPEAEPELAPRDSTSVRKGLRRVPKAPQLDPETQTFLTGINKEAVDTLKDGPLKPFYDRIEHGNMAITRLQQEKDALAAALDQEIISKRETALSLPETGQSGDAPSNIDARGKKRNAPSPSPMRVGDELNGNNDYDTSGHLHHLADKIAKDLDQTAASETIQLCGLAPLRIIATNPDEVLNLACDKLNAYPYQNVPPHWRRLYEDASLHKAINFLRAHAEAAKVIEARPGKRRKKLMGMETETEVETTDWVAEVIYILDKGMSLSGAPGRKHVFDAVFQQLGNFVDEKLDGCPPSFHIVRPRALETQHPIARADKPMGFEDFQTWLNNTSIPLIIPGSMSEWPATQAWRNPMYLLDLTLGGRRVVPIEVGQSYTDADWSQQIMTFRRFMETYLLPEKPAGIGYLAQHDWFAQIPALRNDVMVPDYCYTTPSIIDEAALKTAGLASVKALDEPLTNAWLGPKGTRTPLHTDPYHNILCQVVGYKYVRLCAPSETPKLYPRGVDDKGISMDNTSQVDVSHVRSRSLGGSTDLDAVRAMDKKFPLFKEAKYQEAILGPGECLYIPLGWWHYVESLSTSFSVSFWWN